MVMAFRVVFCLFLCIPAVFSTGEVKDATPDDPDIKRALGFAMKRLNEKANNYYLYMAFETLDSTKQVVAGMNYCVVAAIGSSTKCIKDKTPDGATLEDCPVKEKEQECRFRIWEEQWLPEPMKLTEFKCVQDGHLSCHNKEPKLKKPTEERNDVGDQ